MKRDFTPPSDLGGMQLKALIVGIVGLVATGATAMMMGGGTKAIAQGFLVAYIFWIGISIASLGLLMVQYLGGGGWGLIIRRILESGAHTLILMAVAFLPIYLAGNSLYEWWHPEGHVKEYLDKAWFKGVWLTPTFFLIRAVIYFFIWIGLMLKLRSNSHKQDEDWKQSNLQSSQNWSGPGFLFFGLSVTFASIDWVMSLDVEWYSTIFGMLMLAGWGVATIAFIIWVCVALSNREGFEHVYQTKLFHDLGKLQMALTMVWTYFSFSQLLIIWSGNLPEEIPWYLERFLGVWRYLGGAIILLHFVMPFLLLLSRDLKRAKNRLKWVACLLIGMRFFDLIWYMVPEFQGRHGHVENHYVVDLWVYVAALFGVGGIWLWWFFGQLKSRSLVPANDPQLEEALSTGGHH